MLLLFEMEELGGVKNGNFKFLKKLMFYMYPKLILNNQIHAKSYPWEKIAWHIKNCKHIKAMRYHSTV